MTDRSVYRAHNLASEIAEQNERVRARGRARHRTSVRSAETAQTGHLLRPEDARAVPGGRPMEWQDLQNVIYSELRAAERSTRAAERSTHHLWYSSHQRPASAPGMIGTAP